MLVLSCSQVTNESGNDYKTSAWRVAGWYRISNICSRMVIENDWEFMISILSKVGYNI